MSQLVLNVRQRIVYGSQNFVAHNGVSAVVEGLLAAACADKFGLSVIFGEPGSGKSHLLVALAAKLEHQGVETDLLDGSEFTKWLERWLKLPAASQTAAVLVDDIDLAFKNRFIDDSGPFVAFVERLRVVGGRVVFTSSTALEDFAADEHALSRLRAGHHFHISSPSDEELLPLLQGIALQRGIKLAPEKILYLSARLGRSVGALRDYVETLEQSALQDGAKITKPFAAQVLRSLK